MAVRQFAVAVLVLTMLFRCRAQRPACCESGSCICPYVSRLHNPGNHGYGILTTGKRQWRQHGPATLSPNQLLTTSQAAPPGGEGATTSSHDTDRDDPVISVRVKLHRLAERLHKLREKSLTKASRLWSSSGPMKPPPASVQQRAMDRR
ncbi:PREDICTED: uncharacterized protein LOC109465290 [Branchiostoma belcheri]|uniref:Hypocretin neuropeptide precursor n=1 Tax=Branchiostoma belcheri TaxID=7741 RepID=A0A6P4YLM2_BRABE|nr:PREDICTED: uncharacterized protein LOC109465290 [Branchiostoma belcheri]